MLTKVIKAANTRYLPGKVMFSPDWLVLGVNNICNLHCKMCDVGVDFNQSNFFNNLVGTRPLNMPLELLQKVMDQAARHFPQVKLGYAFTEPLIYPKLVESLKYADALGLYTSITTNALTLKRQAPGLIEGGLNDIFISLDGPPEIHNEIRGHKSSFSRAMDGIDALLASEKRPDISIYCVVTEWNIGHLVEFVEIFKDLPLKQIGFMHTNYTPQQVADDHNLLYGSKYPATASNMEEINLDRMDLDVLYEEMQELKSRDFPFSIVFSPSVETREQLHVFYHHPEVLFGRRCNDIFRNIMIKSNGSVIPAHGRCYNLTIGNLYEESLPELWNSKVIAKFRQDLNKAGGLLPACARCCSAF